MFRILVYDVSQKRIAKVRRYLSDKMYWSQNSTFEGFLSRSQKGCMLEQLGSFLDPECDSICLFSTEADFCWTKRVIGQDKGFIDGLVR